MESNFPVKKLKKLFERSNHNIVKIDPIDFGMTAQAFDCHKKGKNLIFRISSSKQNLLKDKYAYENFDSSVVPIPKFISFGEITSNLFFTVTEKVKGENLDEINSEHKQKRALPLLAKTLDQIHNISIGKKKGFGLWNKEGFAPSKSWENYILSIKNSEKNNWKEMIDKHSMDQSLIEKVCSEIAELIKFCPEKQHLIHGDYGRDNVIWDGSNITGIIDWALSKYGDYLYDIAFLDYFALASGEDTNYEQFFKKHYEGSGKSIKNYHKRLKCYKLHIGLLSARSNLKKGNKENYQNRRETLLEIL